MKYIKYCLFSLLFTINICLASVIPAAPNLKASAWVLLDSKSHQIIAEQNAHQKRPPASLTKMMTSYVVYKALESNFTSLDEIVTVSQKAHKMGGSKMFISIGEKVSVGELLKGINIVSGNDACVAIAEHLYGDEASFVSKMNEYAQALGMKNTQFQNATGWPAENHFSSPYDMAILAKAIINEFPEHYKTYAEKEYSHNNINQLNRNLLLWRNSYVDGLKTGHTEEAGYCLVSSAKKENMRLISSVFGTRSKESRAQESQRLLNYGFRFFNSQEIYPAGAIITQTPVEYGKSDTVAFGVQESTYITIPRGSQKPNAVFKPKSIIEAPIHKGDHLGELNVSINSRTVSKIPVYAMEDVEKSGIFKRIWQWFGKFFSNILS